MPFTTAAAVSVSVVLNSIGVNTHLDSYQHGYQNLPVTEAAINYLGVKNLRDSAQHSWSLPIWEKVAAATGARFDDYMGRGSPAQDRADLSYVKALNDKGILNFVEGGEDSDTKVALDAGNSIAWTASFQKQVYSTGHALGLPVINMSFGAGWTEANDWHGNYDKVGDLSAYADYGNAHTYPAEGQWPNLAITMLNADARLAARRRPVITTEIGWDTDKFDRRSIARFVLDAVFDGIKDGDVKMYFHALYDDNGGKHGLMNSNGTPRPAARALHNLTTILHDTGVPRGGSLRYSLSGLASHDRTLLMRKSTGAFQLVLWNEIDSPHTVTLRLPNAAKKVRVFAPLVASTARSVATKTATIDVALAGQALIVEIDP